MDTIQTKANSLCRACGLCCTGHLFIWSKLRSTEMDGFQELGVKVHREPNQRGFDQPCPLWNAECTIYAAPQYPRHCHTYKCKLLKKLIEETIELPTALDEIKEAMDMIAALDPDLPPSEIISFRERLVTRLANEKTGMPFSIRAKTLLKYFEEKFGVTDF